MADTYYRNNVNHVSAVNKTKMKIIVITNIKMGIKTEVIQVTQMKMGINIKNKKAKRHECKKERKKNYQF